jgi:hypothetical protein
VAKEVIRVGGVARARLEFAGMPLDLFAGSRVSDYAAAVQWCERLFGAPASFFPNDTEAVWEVAEHRFVFIELRAEHARHLIFVDDLDRLVTAVSDRGLTPTERET